MSGRAVVLAGGDSERFGQPDKALEPVDGTPMLAHVLGAVRDATGGPPIVAVGDDERAASYEPLVGDARVVRDEPEIPGPLGGLAAALDAVTEGPVFVCACDMPRLSTAAIEWLRAQCDGDDAVVPVVDGHRQPCHAWYRPTALATAIARRDGQSLHAMLDELAVRDVAASQAPQDLPLPVSTANVNTPGDLAEL